MTPAPYYPADPRNRTRPWDENRYRADGERLLREGRLGCFVVAGGQGSRLGFEGPKGCYPAGPVTGKSLFAIFAEQILAASKHYRRPIPWYIMTSPLNHAPTVEFFERHAYFGLNQDDVSFFAQGVMPSIDRATGRVLLASKHEVATNPDGHGGSLKALFVSGALDDMRARGVEHISYFQVDNPLVKCVDPVFLGLHATAPDSSGEMSSKMLPKRDPAERVGVFAKLDGKLGMVEYSDLPEKLASKRESDGRLTFNAGNPAIHLLGWRFVERLNSDPAFSLPFHRADKKVPCIDPETGANIDPAEPNAVKLERFVFDALPLAERSIILETDRTTEFAPIKNASGEDSSESSRRIQTERNAAWLELHGVQIPRTPQGEPDCVIEISPLTACSPEDLTDLPDRIQRGAKVAL